MGHVTFYKKKWLLQGVEDNQNDEVIAVKDINWV